MNVLVIGSGGREHALVWRIAQSPQVRKIFCAPGNPGIGAIAELIGLKASDTSGLAAFALREHIDLTVVGPEAPLASGIVDSFVEKGLVIFGPTKEAAALEWSKAFAKDFMQRNGIPTAASRTFATDHLEAVKEYIATCPLPLVLKADGLAAGKGVVICATREDARQGIREMMEEKVYGDAGAVVVVEEFLEGVEASVFAVSDGERYVTLASAQDHKRILDGDRGKNTGGMGAYAPTPFVPEDVLRGVCRSIIEPTLQGMAREGRPYRGCLYVGLMLSPGGARVVEFNSRFGDPETQVILPLFPGDLAALLLDAACGRIQAAAPQAAVAGSAACIVLASQGYPDAYPTGKVIHGLEALEQCPGVVAFHAGTKQEGGHVVTAGGRVLGITAFSPDAPLASVLREAYKAVEKVSFDGMHYRRDIGKKGLGL
jgi:phosphoribosylamine--glycine ligase